MESAGSALSIINEALPILSIVLGGAVLVIISKVQKGISDVLDKKLEEHRTVIEKDFKALIENEFLKKENADLKSDRRRNMTIGDDVVSLIGEQTKAMRSITRIIEDVKGNEAKATE